MAHQRQYDLILVGTGFSSSFFLREFLRRSGPRVQVLVLERGERLTHVEYLRRRKELTRESLAQVISRGPKDWNFLLTFGGSSNCWWATAPRMTPGDFEMRSRFGVGIDWPVKYADLEPYYCAVEEAMAVSGPHENSLFPRSRPYPQPPHALSEPDRLLQRAYPDRFFALPSARARLPTPGRRAVCCGSSVCATCPVDAKFTVINEMAAVYADPRVRLVLGARVNSVDVANTTAAGVHYSLAGREALARGDLVVLGAHGVFNPHILLRSGISHPALGTGLVEQVSINAVAYLAGVDNFQGSTNRCGIGYMLHEDIPRNRRAAGVMLTHNTWDVSGLRPVRGKWRQILGLTFSFEDLRLSENRVIVSADDPTKPELIFHHPSQYALSALRELDADLARLLSPLPVDGYQIFPSHRSGDSHIIGTTVMGDDPSTSVLDRYLIHHTVRNLIVLGSGAFPTAAPAHPTLTLSALALWSASRVLPGAPVKAGTRPG